MAADGVPAGLNAGGRALWTDVCEDVSQRGLELRPDEERLLASACRTVDELAKLERALKRAPATVVGSKGQDRPNPLYGEVRAHRLALKQLLVALDLDEGDMSAGAERSHAGRRLARQRWGRHAAA